MKIDPSRLRLVQQYHHDFISPVLLTKSNGRATRLDSLAEHVATQTFRKFRRRRRRHRVNDEAPFISSRFKLIHDQGTTDLESIFTLWKTRFRDN